MALAIRTNPDTGEDEFYDDGTPSDGATGAAYTPGSSQETAANAGEWNARQWLTGALETAGLQDSPLAQAIGYSAAADSQKASEQMAGRSDAPKDDNVLTRVFDKMSAGVSKAYDKDPLKFLEMGLGGVAGVWKAQKDKDRADVQARSLIEQQNNADALKRAEQERYSSSFSTTKRGPVVAKPLTRMNGSEVFDANGRLKG